MLNSLFCEACLPAQGTFVRSTFFLFWRELEQNRAQNGNIKWNFPEMEHGAKTSYAGKQSITTTCKCRNSQF